MDVFITTGPLEFYYTATTVPGGLHTGALNPAEGQYTTAYDPSILSQTGHIMLAKGMKLNTGNKILSQSNMKAQTVLSYIATRDGGNVIGTENLLIDGAGNTTTSCDRVLCLFASAGVNYIPAYCNIVQMGSSYDLTVGSVTTQGDNRFVGTEGTNPVVQNYQINVKPYETTSGSIPAMGFYIRVYQGPHPGGKEQRHAAQGRRPPVFRDILRFWDNL